MLRRESACVNSIFRVTISFFVAVGEGHQDPCLTAWSGNPYSSNLSELPSYPSHFPSPSFTFSIRVS